MQSKLFSPLQIRDVVIRNRIALSPMLTYSAVNGHASDWHFAHYAKYAVGGVGLVMVESTKVDPRGCTTPADLGLWKDDFIPQLQRITSFVKSYGATVGIQLGHSGIKARNSVPWKGRAPLDASQKGVDHGEDWELIGPSAFSLHPKAALPRAMTIKDIQEQIERWGKAAERADRAGFDILELHGAHGYLTHQFLSATTNLRTDEYGGTPEKRMRFAIEVVERVRQSWPHNKPLFYRTSAVDEVGWTIEDSINLAKVLKAKGVDVFDCSSGGMSEKSAVLAPVKPSYGYQVPYSEKIRHGADIMTMAVGLNIHADQAESILQKGQADIVAIGREMLHNPNWALDAASKLGQDNPFATVPDSYAYWLEKRADVGFGERSSTWLKGIDAPHV